MSLRPAYFGPRRPPDGDAAPPLEPEHDTRQDVFNLIPPRAEEFERPAFERPYGLHRPVDLDLARFEALQQQDRQDADADQASPPETALETAAPAEPEPAAVLPETGPAALAPAMPPPAAEPAADPAPMPVAVSNPVAPAAGGMDLTRLSIDEDGRLYWDGKPVEVRRRVALSRGQIAGLSAIGLFAFVAALGAAVQGLSAAHDWGCRLGLIESRCASPAAPAFGRIDLPA